DLGNTRLVRMNDITGVGWTSYTTDSAALGVSGGPLFLSVDASFRIYWSDKYAASGGIALIRVAYLGRMDDMNGSGNTVLHPFSGSSNPRGTALESSGRYVYVVDAG